MESDKIHPEINANWARTTATNIMSEKIKSELQSILTQIKDAVFNNKMCVYANSIDKLVQQELTKRGFKVEYNNVSPIDPRESSYYTISW